MLCCIVLYCIVLYCITLHYIALHCIALRIVVLRCVALRCAALRCVASRRVASHRIASYRIASHRIASHRIVSYRIVSYCIVMLSLSRILEFPQPQRLTLQSDVVTTISTSSCTVVNFLMTYSHISYYLLQRLPATQVGAFEEMTRDTHSMANALTSTCFHPETAFLTQQKHLPPQTRCSCHIVGRVVELAW